MIKFECPIALPRDLVVQLLLKHRRKLLGAIRSMVIDEHLAEDIFQEVSIAAINKCDQIYDVEHFAPWFRGAARLQALMVLRNRNRLPQMLPAEVLDLLEPHWMRFDKHSDADLSDALQNCLVRLSPYARKIIETRYVQGKRGSHLATAIERSEHGLRGFKSRSRIVERVYAAPIGSGGRSWMNWTKACQSRVPQINCRLPSAPFMCSRCGIWKACTINKKPQS